MSERYLVMPRGINVGTRNRVPMAELRAKLVGDGYWDVATVLQSGNVIVSAEEDRPDEVAGAIVLHTGPAAFPLGDRLWALPISSLWT